MHNRRIMLKGPDIHLLGNIHTVANLQRAAPSVQQHPFVDGRIGADFNPVRAPHLYAAAPESMAAETLQEHFHHPDPQPAKRNLHQQVDETVVQFAEDVFHR